MIVPKYWSESTVKKIVGKQQFTIKRFGWSDLSEQDAKSHADSRLTEAVTTLESTGDVRRVDHKTSYNGAEGIPIREEVVSRHQDIVVSRNAYGALCLNTPDVLFGDIDFHSEISFKQHIVALTILSAFAVTMFFLYRNILVFIAGLIVAIIFTPTLASLVNKVTLRLSGGGRKNSVR